MGWNKSISTYISSHFQGRTNVQYYINEVLHPIVIVPFFPQDHGDLQVCQQDNARTHIAPATQAFSQQQELYITFSWDSVPNEHIWDEIRRRLYQRKDVANIAQFATVIQ